MFGESIKKKIKQEVLAKRLSLSQEEVLEMSRHIMGKLMITPEFNYSKVILFYVSSKNEVNTHGTIRKILELGKRVVVPRVNLQKKEIELREIENFEDLIIGAYGILEPEEKCRPVEETDVQLVIVPGIAFDLKGNRIGYGFGYYDKLLSKVTCPKIALAFNFQIVGEITEEMHDVRIEKIITETDVINIK